MMKSTIIHTILLLTLTLNGRVVGQEVDGLGTDGTCAVLTLIPFTDRRKGPRKELFQVGYGESSSSSSSEDDGRRRRRVNHEEDDEDDEDDEDEDEDDEDEDSEEDSEEEWESEREQYYGFGTWPSAESLGKAAYSHLAAVQLAKEHFNARDPSVIPQLSDPLYQACNVTLSTGWFRDSQYTKAASVNHTLEIMTDALTGQGPPICGVVGPTDLAAIEGVNPIMSSLDIPQLVSNAQSRLSDRQSFPSIVRLVPNVDIYGQALKEYIQRPGRERDLVTAVHDSNDFGLQFRDVLGEEDDELGLQFDLENTLSAPETIEEAAEDVVEEGYRTVFLITNQIAFVRAIARAAVKEGAIGEGWFWIITGEGLPPAWLDSLQEEPDSPLDRLLRGAAVFTNYDPFVYRPDDGGRFLSSWRQQDELFMERVNALHPLQDEPDRPEFFLPNASYFQDEVPSEYASFFYDSMVLQGMAKCQLEADKKLRGMDPDDSGDSGGATVGRMLQMQFDGSSGKVSFDEEQNSREDDGVMFGVYNIRPQEVDAETGLRGYNRVLTSIYQNEEWEEVEDFVYYSNSTVAPPLRTTYDPNFISDGVQIFGLTAMAVALAIAIGTGIWVWIMRKKRIVKVAQPEFLCLLCAGSAILAFSIFFVSFDEGKGWSDSQLDKACSAIPWFFVLGYNIMYCAIFSKLWRVSKVMSMRRRKVKMQHALWPFALMITASIAVLIAWQVVDPLTWVREDLSSLRDRLNTYGQCTSPETGTLPFVLPIGLILGTITIMVLFMAWRTKDIQSELSESRWIFNAVFSNVQIWIVGLPLFAVLDTQSADAAYLVRVFLVFFLSTSMVVLVTWPKIYELHFAHKNERQRATSITITGGSSTRVSGLQAGMVSSRHSAGSGSSPRYASSSFRQTSRRLSSTDSLGTAPGVGEQRSSMTGQVRETKKSEEAEILASSAPDEQLSMSGSDRGDGEPEEWMDA